MIRVIRLQVLLIMVFSLLSSDLYASDKQYEDDKEIIEMLDLLENYEIINSMDLYLNMEDIEKINNEDNDTGQGVKEKEDEK